MYRINSGTGPKAVKVAFVREDRIRDIMRLHPKIKAHNDALPHGSNKIEVRHDRTPKFSQKIQYLNKAKHAIMAKDGIGEGDVKVNSQGLEPFLVLRSQIYTVYKIPTVYFSDGPNGLKKFKD